MKITKKLVLALLLIVAGNVQATQTLQFEHTHKSLELLALLDADVSLLTELELKLDETGRVDMIAKWTMFDAELCNLIETLENHTDATVRKLVGQVIKAFTALENKVNERKFYVKQRLCLPTPRLQIALWDKISRLEQLLNDCNKV